MAVASQSVAGGSRLAGHALRWACSDRPSGPLGLELNTFFTSGPEERRAWTIEKNSLAPTAAGKIHTDFEKGFIRAETISYDDFLDNDGWVNSKNNGKMRLEGKDYIVKDGDILNIRFNS